MIELNKKDVSAMAKYCPKCCAGVSDDDSVCGNCGFVLEKKMDADEIFTGGAFKEEDGSTDFISKGYISVKSDSDEILSKEIVADEIIADDIMTSDLGSGNTTTQKPPVYTKASVVLEEPAKVMTLGDWMITLLLLFIPIVNIVMLIVWCADSTTNKNKKHFAQAYLIYMAITFVIAIILSSIFVSIMLATIGSMAY